VPAAVESDGPGHCLDGGVVGRVGHADLRSGLTGGGVPHLGDGLAARERPSQRPAVDGRGVGVANGGVSLDATGPLVADSGRSPHKSQCPEAAWSRSSWWIDGAVARHVPCVDSECSGGRYRLRPRVGHRCAIAQLRLLAAVGHQPPIAGHGGRGSDVLAGLASRRERRVELERILPGR
jgi:hypothetical protein